jgi:hypothetical protein
MGTILEFRVTQCDGRKEPQSARALGEIIIFPGVRIERHGAYSRASQHDDDQPSAEARADSRG